MNMQISARSFTSAAEIIAEAVARRRRFEIAGRHPRHRVIQAPVNIVPKSVKCPEWLVEEVHFDAHVLDWRSRLANPAKTYLRDRCREMDISYRAVIGPGRTKPVIVARQLIMWEIWIMFDFSLPRLGRLFGGRDHTTCLHSVRKMQSKFGSQRIPA